MQQRRGSGSIDVIISEHRHALAGFDRAGEAAGRDIHVLELGGVRKKRPQRRFQEGLDQLRRHSARREHACDDFRQAMGLRESGGEAPIVQAVPPEPAADRPLDAQHRRHVPVPLFRSQITEVR